MRESKKRNSIINSIIKLSMQVNLLVQFHREKYNLCKSHRTMT